MKAITDFFRNLSQNRGLGLCAISALCLLLYSNTFANEFVLNDFVYIFDWPLIQSFSNIKSFFIGFIPPEGQTFVYTPLKTVLHACNYQFFGENPVGHQIIALCIHLIGVIFVYHLVHLLTENKQVSFITAILFAVHPANVESVSFKSVSPSTFGIVLLFGSFVMYMKSFGTPAQRKNGDTNTLSAWAQKKTVYYFSLLFFVLSILTNEQALIFPVLLLLYELCFKETQFSLSDKYKFLAPYFIFALILMLMKWKVFGAVFDGQYVEDSFTLSSLIAIKVFLKYFWLALFPLSLSINHVISPGIFSIDVKDFDQLAVLSQSITDVQVIGALVVLTVLIITAIETVKSKPLISFCIGWFFLSLTFVSPLVPHSVLFAERYLYMSLFAFCLCICICVLELLKAREKIMGVSSAFISIGIIVCLLIGYSTKTYLRNQDWKDVISIYESAIRENPKSAMLYTELGIVYIQLSYYTQALEHLEHAAELKPDEPHIYFSIAEVYRLLESYDKAIKYLEKTIALNPSFAEAYVNMAAIYGYLDVGNKSLFYSNAAAEIYKSQGRLLEAGETIIAFEEARAYSKNKSVRWAVESEISGD